MKNQTGGAVMALIIILVLIATVVGVLFSYANRATDFEVDIKRFDLSSQNTLSSYTLKIKEMAQVPGMYLEDLQKIVRETFEGRYGEDGSQATFQWIQEKNLDFDSSMYRELQLTMRSGRDEFKLSQDRKLEICADYERLYTRPLSGFILRIIGYPDSGIDKMCRVVLDKQTIDTFETGVATEIKLRG